MSKEKQTNRQAARSRRMLQEALVALLREKPYPRISIKDVTDRANLARPTFYAHFETKDHLLLSYVDDIFDDLFGTLPPGETVLPPGDAAGIKVSSLFFRQWQSSSNREILRLVRTADVGALVLNRLREKHLNAYNDLIGPRMTNLNPVLAGFVVEFIASTTLALLRHWVDEDMRQPPEVMGQLLYALSGPPVVSRVVEQFKDAIAPVE